MKSTLLQIVHSTLPVHWEVYRGTLSAVFKMKFLAFSFILTSCFSACLCLHTAGQEYPLVKTKAGTFKGYYEISEFKGKRYNLNRFLGIRYAKPPVGELRFMKPEPYVYDEPHNATQFGATCPQVDMNGLGIESAEEDCLFLNLFLPTSYSEGETGHAVIIFIHGGGFSFGSSAQIPGDVLAAVGNVIVVTFNYRLGFFGFLNPGNETETFPSNVGLWDQRLAIQWVKDNIKKFSGDPNRITLIGESSGSTCAILHGLNPDNEGLFQNLVVFSGTPLMPPGLMDNNSMSAQYLADKVDCYPTGEFFKSCMQSQNITKFMDALKKSITDRNIWRRLNFFPTIDGEFVKSNPVDNLLHSKEEEIPEVKFLRSLGLLVGVNAAEGGLWIMNMGEDVENIEILSTDMVDEFIPTVLPFIVGFEKMLPRVLIDLVQAEYTDWENPTVAKRQYVKLMGDLNFNVPLMEFAMTHANSSASHTWLFRFDALLNEHPLPTPKWLGQANHGDILVPLFGFPKNFSFGRFRFIEDYKPSKSELRLSRRMMTHVSTFAKTGYVPDVLKF